jgi:hypothetical protein
MMAFEVMLVGAATEAGMKVPPEGQLDQEDETKQFDKEEYPHFWVFCCLQLGRPMGSWSEHWDNAKIIADIPVEELKTMKLEDFLAKGLHYCQ